MDVSLQRLILEESVVSLGIRKPVESSSLLPNVPYLFLTSAVA